jgi:hypothetical protein
MERTSDGFAASGEFAGKLAGMGLLPWETIRIQ